MPSGISAAVTSAATELILKPNAMTSQTSVSARPSGQCSANTMPAPVATPLPPLNPWNTGQQCPTNTAIAAAGTVHHGASTSGATWIAANVATNPLTPSPSSVSSAAGLLPVRSTLVAPGLPEPYSCGSG